jgi:hypothetical protein
MKPLQEADHRVSIWAEDLARKLSRRNMIIKSLKFLTASAAGVSVGSLLNVTEAFAATCVCNWIGGAGNANCPSHPGCSGTNCPSGCNVCTCAGCSCSICNDPRYCVCPYPGGSWVSCTGLCTCQGGYRICTDCMCSTCSSYKCTCLSSIICCSCCTPQEVMAAMRSQGLLN